MSSASGVLLKGGQRLWAAEQNQGLVDEMGSQVVNLTGSRRRFIFPSSLQSRLVTVKPRESMRSQGQNALILSKEMYLDSNSQTWPRYWGEDGPNERSLLRAKKSESQRLFWKP